jgi:uncharacterized protein
VIVDTSALLALFDASEPQHGEIRDLILPSEEMLVVSPYVLAELDYLVSKRHGVAPELMVLRELAGGAWELAGMAASDVQQATAVIERYVDQEIGIADASMVVLAHRYGTRTVATLDHRHFDVLRPLSGGRFRVVP